MHQSPLKRRIEANVNATAPLALRVIVTRRLIKMPNTIRNIKPRITTPTMIKGKKENHQAPGGIASMGFINALRVVLKLYDMSNIRLYFRTPHLKTRYVSVENLCQLPEENCEVSKSRDHRCQDYGMRKN